ncbi:MAG: hypothetical protein ABSE19_02485 [Candidatus Acidiferrum sp.]
MTRLLSAQAGVGNRVHAMANFFLRVKHWQIFLFLIVFMLVTQLLTLLFRLVEHRSGTLAALAAFLYLIGIGLFLLFLFSFLGWLASVGFFLASITQPALKLKTKFFRFALIYPAVYFPPATVALNLVPTDNPSILVIIPLHLLAAFCMFYNFYFVAKSLVLAGSGKPASFLNYAASFFLLWFFPVGIWIIQPKVNRLYGKTTNTAPFVPASTD